MLEGATGPCFVLQCPFNLADVDAALTVFVDDVFRTTALFSCRAASVTHTEAKSDKEFDMDLSGIGAAQHPVRVFAVRTRTRALPKRGVLQQRETP